MNNKPVAWIWSEDGCNLGVCLDQDKQIGKQEFQDYDIPLYTHPVKELTDEEIYRLLADSIWAVGLNTDCLDEQNWADGITVARAILRKAQEK